MESKLFNSNKGVTLSLLIYLKNPRLPQKLVLARLEYIQAVQFELVLFFVLVSVLIQSVEIKILVSGKDPAWDSQPERPYVREPVRLRRGRRPAIRAYALPFSPP